MLAAIRRASSRVSRFGIVGRFRQLGKLPHLGRCGDNQIIAPAFQTNQLDQTSGNAMVRRGHFVANLSRYEAAGIASRA
jgi:hypothetical protein